MRVTQLDGDIHRVARHRHQEHVLHRLAHLFGLGGRDPLLEQARKRVQVNHLATLVVAHGYGAIASSGYFVKPYTSTIPSGQPRQLVKVDFLLVHITRKGIV